MQCLDHTLWVQQTEIFEVSSRKTEKSLLVLRGQGATLEAMVSINIRSIMLTISVAIHLQRLLFAFGTWFGIVCLVSASWAAINKCVRSNIAGFKKRDFNDRLELNHCLCFEPTIPDELVNFFSLTNSAIPQDFGS